MCIQCTACMCASLSLVDSLRFVCMVFVSVDIWLTFLFSPCLWSNNLRLHFTWYRMLCFERSLIYWKLHVKIKLSKFHWFDWIFCSQFIVYAPLVNWIQVISPNVLTEPYELITAISTNCEIRCAMFIFWRSNSKYRFVTLFWYKWCFLFSVLFYICNCGEMPILVKT